MNKDRIKSFGLSRKFLQVLYLNDKSNIFDLFCSMNARMGYSAFPVNFVGEKSSQQRALCKTWQLYQNLRVLRQQRVYYLE
jgi:hypothetical protein